ncbi:MAG: methyltransferase domain-containing protein [Planctomycetota bacterium]
MSASETPANAPAPPAGPPAPAVASGGWKLKVKKLMWPGANWVSRDKSRVVRGLLRAKPGESLQTLDCGCGNAYFTYEAAKRGSQTLGITIHDWERRACEEMRDYLGVSPEQMQFRVERLENLAQSPDHHAKYDQVLLFDVIEHIREDRAALRQIHTVLNENGLAFISTPDKDYMGNFTLMQTRVTRVENGWHVRNGYTFEELETALREEGFEPVDRLRFGTVGTTVVVWIQNKLFRSKQDALTTALFPLLKLISWALPWRHTHTIFVLARKVG